MTGMVFDRDAALQRLGGDVELFESFVTSFLEDANNQLAQMRDGVARQNLASASQAAHSLRGSAALLGADDVVEAARRVEGAADLADIDETIRAVSIVAESLRALERDLISARDEIA